MSVVLENTPVLQVGPNLPQYWEEDPSAREQITAEVMWVRMMVDFGNGVLVRTKVLLKGDAQTPPLHPHDCAVRMGTQDNKHTLEEILLDAHTPDSNPWAVCLPTT